MAKWEIAEIACQQYNYGNGPLHSGDWYCKEMGYPNGTAWCAIFVSWCMTKAGYSMNEAYAPTMSSTYNKNGKRFSPTGTTKPAIGDTALIARQSNSDVGHVGVITLVSGSMSNNNLYLVTVEGNLSSTIKEITWTYDAATGYMKGSYAGYFMKYFGQN
jgi:hypothetical protein